MTSVRGRASRTPTGPRRLPVPAVPPSTAGGRHDFDDRTETTMSLPKIASREEWLAARKALLDKEKELTRERDALNGEGRNLPMVEGEKDYGFDGPEGQVGLIDSFEGRGQLSIY